ncbi:MAG: hypothetical protein JST30_12135 [Armatimonadetes bacterium]|nr:hypothetical protein [Armatimonadota bacterium]
MAFSEETKAEAYARAGGRCECKREVCATHYLTRCQTRVSARTANYHRKKNSGLGDLDGVKNCEVLCHTCHANVGMDQFKAH